MIVLEIVGWFFAWTCLLYWVHRLSHVIPGMRKIHWGHHQYVNEGQPKWMWQNMLLYSDDWIGTADLFMTEVIPTLVFCYFTGQWWIFGIYYIWTAFIQEWVEHNPNFNVWPFSSGKWHLIHHKNWRKNYSIYFTLWDRVFGTYQKLEVDNSPN